MDFLFVSTNDWTPFGGSEVLWYKSAIDLRRKGYQVSAFLKKWDDVPNHYNQLKKAGVTLYYKKDLSKDSLRYFKYFITNKFHIKKYEKEGFPSLLNQLKPKHVVVSLGNQNEGVPYTESLQILDYQYSIIIQLANEISIPEDKMQEKVANQYLNAHKLFFTSIQNKKIIEDYCTSSLDRSVIVFNPIELSHDPIPFPDTDNGFNIGFVASLSSNHKGHNILFKVLSLKKWRDRPIRINLYGEGPHSKYLRKLSEYYQLSNVVFKGFIKDKAKIWEENHAAILASRMEGMSLALLEAIGNERVPITTDVGGASEIIINNKTGFIAANPSVKSLDEALERAWDQKDRWKEIGKQGAIHLRKVIPFDSIKKLSEELETAIK